jgi:hypothetical protein
MNAAYRYWHEIRWYPRYYICLDLVVGLSHKDAIADLIRSCDRNGIELFFLRRNLIAELPNDLMGSPCIIDYDRLHDQSLHSFAAGPITSGSHAALIGVHLGYRNLVLLGVDCSYMEKIEGARSAGGDTLEMTYTPMDNPNYFFPGYQIAGDKYQQPNPSPGLPLCSWRAVAPFLKSHGVTVWNCSSLSQVDAFQFCQFDLIEAQRLVRGERPCTLQVVPPLLSGSAEAERENAKLRFLPEPLKRRVQSLYPRFAKAVTAYRRLGRHLVQWPVRILWGRRTGREQASIAFSKATLVAKELKALEEKLDRLQSRDSEPTRSH